MTAKGWLIAFAVFVILMYAIVFISRWGARNIPL
jgi:hypothetical protein